MRKDVGEVIKHALISSEALKDLDGLLGVNLVGVLHSDFGNDLDVLSWVRLQHVVHALERLLLTKLTEEFNDLLLWDSVGVEHNSLDVSHVGVALKGSSVEADLLAHLGNLFPVVLSEQVKLEDSFSNVWCAHEVDLENFGLQVSLIWPVSLKGFKEEGSALLNFVEFQEDVDDLIDLSLWWPLVPVGDHSSKTDSGLGIDWHDLSQDFNKVWLMACLLAVWHDLVELVCLNKSLNDLVWGTRLLIDIESHLWVGLSNKITELIGHGQLLFLDPVLDEVELVLLDDWSSKLNRLDSIQLGCLQKSIEVNEDWGWSASGWQVLELVDGLLVSQESSWGISGNSGCSGIITGSKLLVEHMDEEIVSASKMESLSQFE